MNKNDLFKLYEKIYFHEIDVREKLTSRLQLPLAILVAELSLIGYMLNNKAEVDFSYYICTFWSFYILSCVAISLATYFFIRSWYGYKYSFIASPSSIEAYRCKLFEYHKDDLDKDILVASALNDFLYNDYAKCSSKNTDNNDKRSIRLHRTSTFLITSMAFLFLSFIPFYFGAFDKSQKPQKIIIDAPVELSNRLPAPDLLNTNIIINKPKTETSSKNNETSNKTKPLVPEESMTNKPKSPPPPPIRVIKEDTTSTPSSGGNDSQGTTK